MSFPSIAQLVPHAEPMVLVDEMTEWVSGAATCTLVVRAHAPLVSDGSLLAPLLIEHMAQTVAACLGYEAFLGGEGARVGMIIACKKFSVHIPVVHVGDALTIRVRRVRGNETLSHFDCHVTRGEAPVATAVLTLFHGEPPESR